MPGVDSHDAMETFRTTIRWGSYVFVLLAILLSSSLVLGPLTGSLQAVFLSKALIGALRLAGL
ncbi:MAG: hypothetical protein U5J83_04490 [Bryobacterales bacterium]|nr:hypothetical protein [Bryobacterales bacterium]